MEGIIEKLSNDQNKLEGQNQWIDFSIEISQLHIYKFYPFFV